MGIVYFAKQKRVRKVKITREDKVHIPREIEKIRQLMRSEKATKNIVRQVWIL